MDIRFDEPAARGHGNLAILVAASGKLGVAGTAIDEAAGGMLTRALALTPLPLDKGQVIETLLPAGSGYDRVLLVGVPDVAEVDAARAVELGAVLAAAAQGRKLATLAVRSDLEAAPCQGVEQALALAEGLALRCYRFDRYKPRRNGAAHALREVVVQTADAAAATERQGDLEAVIAGVQLARDLVNRPANDLDTRAFVAAANGLVPLGVTVEILDRDAMTKLGMGALLGVAQGSHMEPTVVMRWQGAGDDRPPVALVGKGVVFDSGGLSLKPAKSMETMKCDMAGAAAVLGALHALAIRKARANVVGAVGLVENMPSGTAQRPGDVVTSLAGKTIEVLNTDAEGRLVLADVLWHVHRTVKPCALVDFATLAGAIIVALGYEHAGLFANDEDLAAKLLAAGQATGETLWRMPLGKGYAKQLESPIADLKNIGKPGQAGASVAAAFLEAFVDGTPWAHVDLAATSFVESEHPVGGRGGTGWGVRLIDRFVKDGYEA